MMKVKTGSATESLLYWFTDAAKLTTKTPLEKMLCQMAQRCVTLSRHTVFSWSKLYSQIEE